MRLTAELERRSEGRQESRVKIGFLSKRLKDLELPGTAIGKTSKETGLE